mgnify:CR=1 FL=1
MGQSCILGHKWNGCKCERCGKVRDKEHQWDACRGECTICRKKCKVEHEYFIDPKTCKMTCKKCGHTTGQVYHEWDGCICRRCGATGDYAHDMNGCTCRRCGKVDNRFHEWVMLEGRCEQRCAVCGKVVATDHDWDACQCKRCGAIRNSGHSWIAVEGKCEEQCEQCHTIRVGNHAFEDTPDGLRKCARCGLEAVQKRKETDGHNKKLSGKSKKGFRNNMQSGTYFKRFGKEQRISYDYRKTHQNVKGLEKVANMAIDTYYYDFFVRALQLISDTEALLFVADHVGSHDDRLQAVVCRLGELNEKRANAGETRYEQALADIASGASYSGGGAQAVACIANAEILKELSRHARFDDVKALAKSKWMRPGK